MRKLHIAMSLLLLPLIASGAMYRWVDRNGVVHFTDTPRPGASRIQEREIPTYQPVATPASANTSKPLMGKIKSGPYEEINIASPRPEETIRNSQGYVSIKVKLVPSLDTKRGDSINIYLDGKVVGQNLSSTIFSLKGVDRGIHRLVAEVSNKNKQVLMRSPTVKFFVHQPSKRRVPLGKLTPGLAPLTPAHPLAQLTPAHPLAQLTPAHPLVTVN